MFNLRIVSNRLENGDTMAENVEAIYINTIVLFHHWTMYALYSEQYTAYIRVTNGDKCNEQFVKFWIVGNGKCKCIRHYNTHFNSKNKLHQQTENPTVFISQWTMDIRKVLGNIIYFFVPSNAYHVSMFILDMNTLLASVFLTEFENVFYDCVMSELNQSP